MRLSRIILFLLIGVFIAQTAYFYPNLPTMVATHYDGTGNANGWMTKEGFILFELILLLVLVAEFTLLPLLIEKMPDSLINIPNKNYWLAPEKRVETFAAIRNYFEWFSVMLLLLLTAVNQLVFRANINRENLPAAQIWVIIGAFLLFVIVWLISLVSRFRKIN